MRELFWPETPDQYIFSSLLAFRLSKSNLPLPTKKLLFFCVDTLEWHNFLRLRQSADRAGIEIASSQGKYAQKENESIYHEQNKILGRNNSMYHT